MSSSFAVRVTKENLKFSAAHFIAYPGFREPLHGHNYQVGVTVEGRLSPMGYVLDFGLIKRLLKEIVDRFDERTIIPRLSDCLHVESSEGQVRVRYEQDDFVFPAADVALLDIVHSSAEELARFIWHALFEALRDRDVLRDVMALEIAVAEGPGQAAYYRQEIPH